MIQSIGGAMVLAMIKRAEEEKQKREAAEKAKEAVTKETKAGE